MSEQIPQHEIHNAITKIKSSQTIGEVLETAMSFEKTAQEFYTSLLAKVNKPMRALVKELADEEQQHYDLFKQLAANPNVTEHINERIATPANDHRFSDYIHLPELGDNPDDQSILQYALGREHAAMEQYQALADEVPAGPLQDVFVYLAREELEHKKELEKYYYELVHSGGV